MLSSLQFICVVAEGGGLLLNRQKREWIIAPRKLRENYDYTTWDYIAKIRSDKEYKSKVTYSLTGAGANEFPMGLFSVNPDTGLVRIHGLLDREKKAFYNLMGVAKYSDGTRAEKDIELRITVLDENDCPPVFKMQQMGSVSEASAAGTVVMRVFATDDDEANTTHSQIHYSIVEKSISDRMFSIRFDTGEILVRQSSLDRETQDSYTLTVKGTDMNGALQGNSGTAEVAIQILDINDQIPTLEKESYEGSVQENTVGVEVMRIKAIDLDLMYSDNWLAVFSIISGNEAGYFSITTDAKTNEGIIMIHKPLDYEELKVLNLGVVVANKAEYNFGSSSSSSSSSSMEIIQKPYPVKINVVNQKEGPRFKPSVKVVTISEDRTSVTINKIITNYAAIDSDTLQTATNVRYAKLYDVDNWLIVDGKTADIKLNKMPDRESKYLVNGTYTAHIICITNDMPSKTATGTIAIQVEDFNDNCPKLTATTQTMCLEDNAVYVTAVDADEFPNSAPFDFRVIRENSKERWTVEHLNETSAILRDHANLWPGIYKVALEIKDQQGKSCADVQVMDVVVCTCHETIKTCVARETGTATFGAPGVLLLLLGLLLLLLVPLLLLFCLCGGAAAIGDFKAIPFETKQQLIAYHTEGQGEDKVVPLLTAPVEVSQVTGGAVDGNAFGMSQGVTLGGAAAGAAGGGFNFSSLMTRENMHMYDGFQQAGGQMEVDYMGGGTLTGQETFSRYKGQETLSRYNGGAYSGMALSEGFLEEYYSSKANHAAEQAQQKDALLVYTYEGQESPAGSVGCCSLLDNEDDLEFLNDLGPKFKTLAEICQGSTLVTESVDVGVSVYPPRPVSPARPSTHTHTHTHTETFRDRDRVNVNTLNTSNVASGSSTIIQEELFREKAQGSAQGSATKVHVQDNVVIPSQTMYIQQPTMYYAATPMYMVESNPQMVLVSGGTQQAVSQGGLGQGLVQVGGVHGSQGMVLVDRHVGMGQLAPGLGVHGSQGSGMVLVDRHVGMGGGAGQIAPGFSQGSVSRSRQVLVVENGSASSGVGGSTGIAQAILQTGQGSSEQGVEVRGHGLQVKGVSWGSSSQCGSTGSNEDFALTATPTAQGGHTVVVQHKKAYVAKVSGSPTSEDPISSSCHGAVMVSTVSQ
ncbi:desmoglein-2-like protein [Diretmus argenteus]